MEKQMISTETTFDWSLAREIGGDGAGGFHDIGGPIFGD